MFNLPPNLQHLPQNLKLQMHYLMLNLKPQVHNLMLIQLLHLLNLKLQAHYLMQNHQVMLLLHHHQPQSELEPQ